ncbi:MAG TPA: tRNA preQ1(34) S-adenosylmethionine ribosyltransferase-isomerase QueA [Verrucomicrobiae bacterium]|nr:tRNA preQ1(34) S-adenosylmethionine ribosyltransferase-isomerase QueA [Verrucomicrobiae bacterium]
MLLQDFDFELPEELIAQEPPAERGDSRLMLVDRGTGSLGERGFGDLPQILRRGDLLVLNNTRVIPARLYGKKDSGGKVEIFLLRRCAEGSWSALLRASKPSRPGTRIHLAEGAVATVLARGGDDWRVSFSGTGDFGAWLARNGRMPLPPYISREAADADSDRYQTVFASVEGAVAAPTAGLHLTPRLLEELRGAGVEMAELTLHVGAGTFLPIREEEVSRHRMHLERYDIPAATAEAVAAARRDGRRVIAVGTTSARALEAAAADGTVVPGEGETDIFIFPGYRFRVVDALITNFHLPKSTLLLLVSALAGRELILEAYREAVRRRFRFFSYGDAMFIS